MSHLMLEILFKVPVLLLIEVSMKLIQGLALSPKLETSSVTSFSHEYALVYIKEEILMSN